MDDKMKVFMELCDDNGNGKVSPEELYGILKQNLFNHDDKVKLKQIVRQIFKENDIDGDGNLDREELYNAVTRNSTLRGLLEESIRNVKRVD
jgi:Ca2+-binding EF-hand superfamily protein